MMQRKQFQFGLLHHYMYIFYTCSGVFKSWSS